MNAVQLHEQDVDIKGKTEKELKEEVAKLEKEVNEMLQIWRKAMPQTKTSSSPYRAFVSYLRSLA